MQCINESGLKNLLWTRMDDNPKIANGHANVTNNKTLVGTVFLTNGFLIDVSLQENPNLLGLTARQITTVNIASMK